MEKENENMAEVIAWADKFIEEHRDMLERMHVYTSKMRRLDQLAKHLIEMHRKKSSNYSDAR